VAGDTSHYNTTCTAAAIGRLERTARGARHPFGARGQAHAAASPLHLAKSVHMRLGVDCAAALQGARRAQARQAQARQPGERERRCSRGTRWQPRDGSLAMAAIAMAAIAMGALESCVSNTASLCRNKDEEAGRRERKRRWRRGPSQRGAPASNTKHTYEDNKHK